MKSPLGIFTRYYSLLALFFVFLLLPFTLNANPYPPTLSNGAAHYAPAPWPADDKWKPYSRFGGDINDPRTSDPSNGGTRPQNYVNIASSCVDETEPSVYYYLYKGATPADDVIMFRWRVEQIANTYATGPSAGSYSSGDAWGSALWTVLFDIDGDGVRDLAAHLDGSSGSPSKPIDVIVGIYGEIPTQSLDYNDDPTNIHVLGHNPTAFVGTDNKIQNFHSSVSPDVNWSNGSDETVWDYGTTRSSVNVDSPCKEYYIDYQIPMAMIDASGLGGPKLTRDTPISMLFCTANSLNNPFQKDCAINATWIADPDKPAPFGDYISFDRNESYTQVIVDDIGSSGCNPVTLTAKVKDSIAIVNGEAVSSVASVSFYYYRDSDGNSIADDAGEEWHKAADAAPIDFVNWTANWNSSALFQGQYLIGVQTKDNPLKVDANMDTNGTTNVTFSYLTQDQVNTLASNTPKPPGETWWANPEITGVKSIALAVNICGTAPTIVKTASVSNVLAGEDINFTIIIDNNSGFDINATQIQDMLPEGFSYKQTISLQKNGSDISYTAPSAGSTGTVSWIFDTASEILDTEAITLIFEATATIVSGSYNNVARADTSFGSLVTDPVPVQVDAARISLSKTPSTYFISPGDDVNYTLEYSNDSNVELSSATITDTLPSDVTCVTYSVNGGADVDCSAMGSSIAIALGTLTSLEQGSIFMTVTTSATYPSSSLLNTAIFEVVAPDGSDVNRTAKSTIAVDVPLPVFTLDKTTTTPFITPGDTITWTIAYTNYGTENSASTFIMDTLPEGFTYSSCIDHLGGITNCSEVAGVVTWDIGAVALGASGSVTVTAVGGVSGENFLFPNPALNTATITWSKDSTGVTATNEVGLSGKSCSDIFYFHSDLSADSTYPTGTGANTTLNASAMSFITSAMSSETIIDGKELAVRVYLDPATGNADMDIEVIRIAVDTTETTITTTNLSMGNTAAWYDVIFNVPGGEAPLAVGEKLKYVFTYANNKNLTIYYDGDTGTGIFADSQASICVANAPAVLTIAKTADLAQIDTASLPQAIVYTIDYTNIGGGTANNLILTDTLPVDVTFVSAIPAETSIVGQVATFNVPSLASGASGTITINATVTAAAAASGTLTNTAVLDSDETTPVQDTANTIVGSPNTSPPSLVISKDVNVSYISANDTVRYTLTVVNTGGRANNIVVTDLIPQQPYFGYLAGSIAGSTNGTGIVVPSDAGSPTLSWAIDSLALGEVATLTFDMNSSATGIPVGVTTLDNNATVSDLDYCTDISIAGCTSNVVPVSISGNPDLSIVKTASNTTPQPDELITYTIVVTNSGSSDATDTVVNDPIPSNMIFEGNSTTITATVGSGSFDGVNNRMVYDIGTLVAGGTATLTFQARVKSVLDAGTTTIVNTAAVSAGNAPEESATATITSTAGIDLTVNIGGPSSGAFPSATVDQNTTTDTISVDDASQFSVGQVVQIGSSYYTITAISGNIITLDTPATVNVGDEIIGSVIYSVIYENHGDADALDTNLTVVLPAGILYYDAVSTPDSVTAGTVTWNLGTVGSGDSGSFQVMAFPSATGSYTITTNIRSTDTIDNNELNNSDEITTIFGGLKIEKSTSTPVVVQPSSGTADVNYTITIHNTLDINISDVNVTDTLPAGFNYSSTTSVTGSLATPAYDVNTTYTSQPQWTGIKVPANGTVTIEFIAQITDSVGAATYQNAVYVVTGEANTSVTQYDELSHPDEDVTVLNPTDALIEGYIFEDKNGNNIFDAGDIPYTNVEVTISDDNSSLYYTAITDGSGYFLRVVAEGNWTINHDTTDINSSLSLATGFSNPTSVVVPAGGTVVDLNPYVDFVGIPSFTVEKATSSTPTAAGQTLTYTFDVNNTGNVTLTDINLTDVKCDGAIALVSGDNGDGDLDVGETHVYSCTSIAVEQTEIDAGSVFNEVIVEATPPSGTIPPVEDNLTTPVPPSAQNASFTVEKATSSTPTAAGQTLTYTFDVNNTGNVTLTDINLTDVKCDGAIALVSGDNGDGDLDVGETHVYSCTSIAVEQTEIDAGSVFNEVIVEATPPSGTIPPVEDNLTTPVPPSAQNASFTVEKATSSTPTAAGQTLTYTFDVNNTGNVTLTDINLTDVKCDGAIALVSGDNGDGDLDVGETHVYSCTSIAVEQTEIDAGSVFNEVIVEATPPSGTIPPVEDNLTTPVPPSAQNASFTVEKATSSTPTAAGQTLTYTFDVNNTGNVTLTDINLTDVKCDGAIALVSGDNGDGDLDVGETHVYSCTSIAVEQTEIDAGSVFNEVIVEATPPSGTIPPVEDNLTTPVPPSAQNGNITLEKIGTFNDENNDGYANVNETISYEFNVTNTGNVTLYDINLTDDNAVITGGPISSMIPGESDITTFTGVHTITWQDIIDGKVINQAIVVAKDPYSNDVNDTSDDPTTTPDDNTTTGLPIEPPSSTDNDYNAKSSGIDVTIDVVGDDSGGTFALDRTTVTLTPPTGATGIVTDTDGDTIGFVVPDEGTWSVDETTGEVTFSPEDGYIGDPTPIEYTVEDIQGNPTTSLITINYPPVALDDLNNTASVGDPVVIDVLANDKNTSLPLDPESVSLVVPVGAIDVITDSDGDIIGFTIVDEGEWSVDEITGVVTFVSDNTLVNNPSDINYTVKETNGDESNKATITIEYPEFGRPIATDNLDIPVTSYNPIVIDVLANGDVWGNNGPGTVEIIFTQPTHGSVALDDGGTPNDPTDDVLIYTPAADVNNITDSFTYTITDAQGNTSTATVTVNVDCASSQSSDGGDALGTLSIMLMMFLTLMSGLYFARKEEILREERGEA